MLGKITHNKTLAQCLFTTSIERSRSMLMERVWFDSPAASGGGGIKISDAVPPRPKAAGGPKRSVLSDETIAHIVQRKDEIDYVRALILNGDLYKHDRINTLEKLATFVAELQGPSLKDVMMMDMRELSKRNVNLSAVPLTEDEHQMQQLDEAIALYERMQEHANEEPPPPPAEPEPEPGNNDYIVWPMNPKIAGNPALYTWYRTVWYRVNYCHLFLPRSKAKPFVDAHVPLVQYLDSLADPRDDLVNHATQLVYTPLRGAPTMNENLDYSRRALTWYKVRENPLEVARRCFPKHWWTVEEVVAHVLTDDNLEYDAYLDNGQWAPIHPQEAPLEQFRIYYACIYLCNQCKELLLLSPARSAGDNNKEDALWAYYAGFVDFFSYVASVPSAQVSDTYLLTPVGSTVTRSGEMHYSDKLTPWEMHGAHAYLRAKHAGDLPDLFHVLHSIPLSGEQCTPSTRIGKIYQKSLPFACQRRHIITLIVNTIRSDDAFWALCSQLFWVMLAGLYPGDDRSVLTMRDLMRAKQLTGSKDEFVRMLQPCDPPPAVLCDPPPAPPEGDHNDDDNHTLIPDSASGGVGVGDENGGPLVVFTAFRMHIIYMASFNPVYVETARECLDWDRFVENTLESAELIRESDLLPADPLARARALLVKTVKNPNARVGRIRRRSLAVTLTDRTNEILEKVIIKDYYRRRQMPIPTELEMMDKHFKALRYYEHILSPKCKSAISNMLLRIPPEDRFTLKAFSVLTLPEYGGVSLETVERMYDLTRVYHTSNGMPKDFNRVLDQFEMRYFVIACYYFNMATELEGISFVPLDAETVRRTDEAMIHTRYHLFPGQPLPPNAYTVHIALCCGRVCTLMGQGKYGAKTVAFDVESQCFVCSRGKIMHSKNKLGADDEDTFAATGDADADEETFLRPAQRDEDGDDEDDEGDEDQVQEALAAQNDHIEPVENLLMRGIDLVSDAVKKNGRGTKRSKEMEARKAVRTERKRFNRIPCGQPVLTIDLRGRALIWGTTREKQRQYMFCPQCGAFHIYSVLNFAGAVDGRYRCNECASKESGHRDFRKCAYCERVTTTSPAASALSEHYKLPVMTMAHPRLGGGGEEWMYFCRTHYYIAKRYNRKCGSREMLWSIIQRVEHKRMMDNAKK